MSPNLIRLALVVFIVGIVVGLNMEKIAAQRAIFILSAISIILGFLNFRYQKIFIIFTIVVLAAMLRIYFFSQDKNFPSQFEAMVYQDTAPTTYGSLTIIHTPSSGAIRMIADRYPEFMSGDRIKVTLKSSQPEHGRFILATAELLARNEGNWFVEIFAALRRSFIKGATKVLPEPAASFAAGTVVGGSSGLPADLKESISISGLSHVLAASGYNFSLLLIFLGLTLRSLSLRHQTLVLLLVVPAFIFIAGASPPVIRAGIMASLTLIAILSGRLAMAKTVVLWAAALMLIINPTYILFDLGWQLSFLATLALVWLLPIAERLIGGELFEQVGGTRIVRLKNFIISLLLATLVAQLATMPLLAFTFGRLSLVSLPVNVLVLPFVPLIMISTAFASLASFIWLPLGQIIAAPAWLVTNFVFKVANLAAGLPQAEVRLDYSLSYTLITYGVLLGGGWYLRNKFFNHRHLKTI